MAHKIAPAGVVGFIAGAHSSFVLETLRARGLGPLVGILDPRRELWGTDAGGVLVLGGEENLDELIRQGTGRFFVGIYDDNSILLRQKIFERALARGLTPISAVHSTAWVSGDAWVGRGVSIGAGCIIEAGARIDDGAILQSGTIVGYDVTVGKFARTRRGACLESKGRMADGVGDCPELGVRVF